MRRVALGIAVLAAIVLNGAGFASAAACGPAPAALGKYQPAEAGRVLPQAAYVTADGVDRRVDELRGRGLVLNLWATWCAPCVEEMPALDRLAAAGAARGLDVLALSSDREGAPVVRRFYEVNKIGHLPVALDKTGRVARALGATGLPTTVLFDAAGREVGRMVGVAEWDAPAALDFLSACLAQAR
jgi:thiol-disulfide isomerase/thioredoxin